MQEKDGKLRIGKHSWLRIRRTLETKEIECYVYEDGWISSSKELTSHGLIVSIFTHTIKIPKK